jgi:RNA polymerase sigma-70 factor (ECF subfamily)
VLPPDLAQAVAAARRRFEERSAALRPDLHRFCTRMTGDPCDGEDVLQDALATAFYRLGELRDDASFRSWVFRIAHNRCIDLLRARRRDAVPSDAIDDAIENAVDDGAAAGAGAGVPDSLDDRRRVEGAVTRMVVDLPPRERACVILKDLLEHSLDDIAAITGSSLGAVKAALHRGRAKLARTGPPPPRRLTADDRALVERYLAAFNRRDWDGVLAVLASDARLEVVTASERAIRDSSYFTNYGKLAPWKLALAFVDGIECVVHFRWHDGAWVPRAVVQLAIEHGVVTRVRDFVHVDYLLADSDVRDSDAP